MGEDKETEDKVTKMKRHQTASLSAVSKKINEITKLMQNDENLPQVKIELEKYDELFQTYEKAHAALFNELLNLPSDQDREYNRYLDHEKSIQEFRRDISKWIETAEGKVYDQIDQLGETRSSQASSSKHSSHKSARAREKARLAALLVEQEHQAVKQELKAREEAFNLKLEIAKARVREQVYAELDAAEEVQSTSSTLRSVSSKKQSTPHMSLDPMNKLLVQTDATAAATSGENAQAQVVNTNNVIDMDLSIAGHKAEVNLNETGNDIESNAYSQLHAQKSEIAHININKPNSKKCDRTIGAYDNANVTVTNQMLYPSLSNVNDQQGLNPHSVPFYPKQMEQSIQQQILKLQQQQNQQLTAAHQLATIMSLPQPEVSKFCGDVTEYYAFIRAFEARIASRSNSDADCLYYLDQLLIGEPKDLIGGCLHMDPIQGYHEARTLLQREYGDPYKISVAYIDAALSWPNVKHDDAIGWKKSATS